MDSAHDLNALFSRLPSGLDFPGPFEWHEVVLHGHMVPFLRATPIDGGVHINLDGRYGLDLTAAQADEVIPFVADCIAVAMGYSCFPKPACPDPPALTAFPKLSRLTLNESDSPTF